MVLDRSGSMERIADDTIGGYNAFVKDQQVFGGTMTLVQFDNKIETLYDNIDIADVKPLDRQTFVPRGTTALYDAIGFTIDMAESYSELHKDTEFKIIIVTDGFDNASTSYTCNHVKDIIRMCTRLGWDFMFLGASKESILAAKDMGLDLTQTLQFDPLEVTSAFKCLSDVMSQQAQGNVATLS